MEEGDVREGIDVYAVEEGELGAKWGSDRRPPSGTREIQVRRNHLIRGASVCGPLKEVQSFRLGLLIDRLII